MSMGMGATDDDPLAAATVVFAYSTTWRSEDALHLAEPLHAALLRRLGGGGGGKGRSGRRAGTVVFTTDKRFRDGVVVGGRGFRVVGQVDVPNPEVWESTAHVHELFEVDGDEEGERV